MSYLIEKQILTKEKQFYVHDIIHKKLLYKEINDPDCFLNRNTDG